MLTLTFDALLALAIGVARLARWLLRDHADPALCVGCAARSAHHPAGSLHRHTSTRLAGLPVCERHTTGELLTHLRNGRLLQTGPK